MEFKGLQTHLEAALEACWRAGKITLEYYQTHPLIETKTDGSPVTIADRRAEQEIRKMLAKYFPHDAIVGEEEGAGPSSAHGTWYIDPIDGTYSFVCGVPFYGVLLAYEIDRDVALGVINFPALDDMIWALRGQGCFWNGRRTHVSAVTELRDATLLSTDFFCVGHIRPRSGARKAVRRHQIAAHLGRRLWLCARRNRPRRHHGRRTHVGVGLRPASAHSRRSRRPVHGLERQRHHSWQQRLCD